MRAWILMVLLAPACATAQTVPGGSGPLGGAIGTSRPAPPTPDAGQAPDAQPAGPASPFDEAAARADASAGRGDLRGALQLWSLYASLDGVREHEKAFARARADEVAGRLAPDAALEIWRSNEGGVARGAAGPRAAAALRARGDAEGARRADEEAAKLRESQGWTAAAAPWVGPGDPSHIGLAIPLSGRAAVGGEAILRGAMMALGDGQRAGNEARPIEFAVRDSAAAKERQGQALLELTRREAALAIVGTSDALAGADAGQHGIPFLALTDQAPGASTTAYQVFHASETRAAELGRRAIAQGVRTFAVLGPDTPTGRHLAEAFGAAVTAAGGKVTARLFYPTTANSFTAQTAQLAKSSFDAVFVPDDAAHLALIAPALAFADLRPQPASEIGRRTPGRPTRNVLLLSTASALTSDLLRHARQHVQGALLAPGFFPDGDDTKTGGFVERFQSLYGRPPEATDAYAYDAVRLVLSAVERGARTRAEALQAIESGRYEGVTGAFRFGPDHGRIDAPLVYVVEGDSIRSMK